LSGKVSVYQLLKTKDTPWDAVLMGSVACTVDEKVMNKNDPRADLMVCDSGSVETNLRKYLRKVIILLHICKSAFSPSKACVLCRTAISWRRGYLTLEFILPFGGRKSENASALIACVFCILQLVVFWWKILLKRLRFQNVKRRFSLWDEKSSFFFYLVVKSQF